jgi:D-psicose/D-tagatose/L-ribulose 3-epimerase
MNNKIGIFYAYWEHNWNADFIPYIGKVASIGFNVLEINAVSVVEMPGIERKRLGKLANEAGIELTLCVGLSPVMDPSSPDKKTRRQGVEFLKSAVLAMKDLNAKKLSGIIYCAWPTTIPEGENKQSYIARSVESMKEAIKPAEENDIFFNLEVVNRFEGFMLNTVAEAKLYLDQVGSPNLLMLLDTFHMNIEEDFIGDAIRQAGKFLGHLHVGENNRRPPGNGHLPWDEIFIALKDINYEGHIVMEPFLMPGGEIGRDIRVFRDLSFGGNLDEQAKKALIFIHDKLKIHSQRR